MMWHCCFSLTNKLQLFIYSVTQPIKYYTFPKQYGTHYPFGKAKMKMVLAGEGHSMAAGIGKSLMIMSQTLYSACKNRVNRAV